MDVGPECALRFWDMDPDELGIRVECWNRREAREMDRLAILICFTQMRKKKLRPKQILGRELGRRKKKSKPPTED